MGGDFGRVTHQTNEGNGMGTKRWVVTATAPVLLGIGGWFLYALFKADAAVQSGVLALVGVVAAGIIAHSSAMKREIEARHFDEKREGYKNFVDLMFDAIVAEKFGKKRLSERELHGKMLELKKMLLTWADAHVIKTWNELEMGMSEAQDDPDAAKQLLIWDGFLRQMRKDLGKDDSQLAKGELISLILRAEDKHKVRGKD